MLTWNELKELVDRALEENGMDGEIQIEWVNLHVQSLIDNTEVFIEKNMLQIS